jgi:bifunctional non-homologous end joining protein LigD
MSEIIVAGVRLTSPDKILYAEQGITKAALADYYVAVADAMLPHLARRPLTMVRCPAGQEQKCFYQRHAGSGVPDEIEQVTIPGFEDPYLYIEDVRGLIAMVQMGVLEIHPWGVTIERPEQPDRIIFDLDPAEGLAMASSVSSRRLAARACMWCCRSSRIMAGLPPNPSRRDFPRQWRRIHPIVI